MPQLTSESLTRSNTPLIPVSSSPAFNAGSDAFPAPVSGVVASFSIPAVKYQHILLHIRASPDSCHEWIIKNKTKAKKFDLGPIAAYIFLS